MNQLEIIPVYHKEEQMELSPVEEFVSAIVRWYKEVERITRVEYEWDEPSFRIFFRDGDGERELRLSCFSKEVLRARLAAIGAEFIGKAAERLFQHAGYEVDSADHPDPERHIRFFFRKEDGLHVARDSAEELG